MYPYFNEIFTCYRLGPKQGRRVFAIAGLTLQAELSVDSMSSSGTVRAALRARPGPWACARPLITQREVIHALQVLQAPCFTAAWMQQIVG